MKDIQEIQIQLVFVFSVVVINFSMILILVTLIKSLNEIVQENTTLLMNVRENLNKLEGKKYISPLRKKKVKNQVKKKVYNPQKDESKLLDDKVDIYNFE